MGKNGELNSPKQKMNHVKKQQLKPEKPKVKAIHKLKEKLNTALSPAKPNNKASSWLSQTTNKKPKHSVPKRAIVKKISNDKKQSNFLKEHVPLSRVPSTNRSFNTTDNNQSIRQKTFQTQKKNNTLGKQNNLPSTSTSTKTSVTSNTKQINKNKKKTIKKSVSKKKLEDIDKCVQIVKKSRSTKFIESNVDDIEQNKVINAKLQEKKEKINKALGIDSSLPVEIPADGSSDNNKDGPSIIVHNVANNLLATESDSDSEGDSYIDQFFNGNNDSDEFDENRVYSADEIENKKVNGFLCEGSETDGESTVASVSDENLSSTTESSNSYASDISIVQNQSTTAENNVPSPDNKLAHYNGESDVSQDNENFMYIDHTDDSDAYTFDDYFQSDLSEDDYEDESSTNESFSQFEVDSDEAEEEETDYDGSLSEEHELDSNDLYEECSDNDYYGKDDSDEHSFNETEDESINENDTTNSNDTDFYDSEYDDLRVAEGTAITYKLTDKRIKLFENDTKPRLLELPKSDSEDENCVELVSIHAKKADLLIAEQKKIAAKKMHETHLKLEQERCQLEQQRKYDVYYKLDEPDDTKTTEAKINPVIITCLPGSLGNYQLDASFFNETANDERLQSNSFDVDLSIVANQSIITSVPIKCVLNDEMNIDEDAENDFWSQHSNDADKSYESDEAIEKTNLKYNSYTEIDESQWETNRNSSLTKSQLNKTKPKFFNSTNSRHVLLLLRNIIYFHGNLHVKLVAGSAQAFGYELITNKSVTVHSPRGHSLIYLIPSSAASQKPEENLNAILNEYKSDFFLQDIEYLLNEFNEETDAIVLLERDTSNKGVNMIDRYMREKMFPNINAFNNDSPYYSSEFILHCQFSFRPRTGLVLNNAWSSVKLANDSKLVTIGGKGVGKSTFVRYTINSNLEKFNKFLLIDLDIGQPELFLPQTISATLLTEPILGPGYLKNIPPSKAILFGDINVLPDPIKYLRCVLELHQFCSTAEEFKNIPWIINTMGYSRGFGMELVACILKIFQPTDLVQIQSESPLDNFDKIVIADEVNTFKFHVFEEDMKDIKQNCAYETHVFMAIQSTENGQKKHVDMTPKDIRYAMVLSKLGNCLRCNSDWLTSVRPFEASLADLEIIITSGEEINPNAYADILNANLVYLCENRKNNSKDIVDCHGIGIVRAVDTLTEKIYLLSSIPFEALRRVNALAIGAIPLPTAVLLNQHSQVRGTVPYVYNSDDFVGSKQVAQHIYRSQYNRKSQPIELMEN